MIENSSLSNRCNRCGYRTQNIYLSNRVVIDSKSNTWFHASNLQRLLNTKTLCSDRLRITDPSSLKFEKFEYLIHFQQLRKTSFLNLFFGKSILFPNSKTAIQKKQIRLEASFFRKTIQTI